MPVSTWIISSDLNLIFQAYNQLSFSTSDEDSTDGKTSSSLVLYPEKVKFASFSFVPLMTDIDSKLEVFSFVICISFIEGERAKKL